MRAYRCRFDLHTCALSFLVLLTPTPGVAQTAGDKAAAEALFREATGMMEAQAFEAACPKYQASQELDPTLGTLLRLADCFDRTGKTASAWALFAEAEALALRSNQPERVEIAATRAADLRQRLSMLTLVVPEAHAVEGLSISINGAQIPRASWGTALPFDPGIQDVEVSAPGHRKWASNLELPAGPTEKTLTVPRLKPEPQKQAAPREPFVTTRAAAVTDEPAVASTQETVGYVLGATGIVGLATAGAFVYRAYGLNQDSLKQCASDNPNACTSEGKNLRDQAARSGSVANVVGGLGGAMLLTGLVLVLTTPDEPDKSEGASIWLRPELDRGSTSVLMQGLW